MVAGIMLVCQLAFAGSPPAAATILLASSGSLELSADALGVTAALAGLLDFRGLALVLSEAVTVPTSGVPQFV
ncbi:MAG: hypothetical protein LC751_14440 [Actinobacteria bacterium]|nr:hypothetical protein [Actinomycetota bacterium]